MSNVATTRQANAKPNWARQWMRWMDATPHPPLAIEISQDRVAGARFTRKGTLEKFAVEEVPKGAIVPSAIETNLVNPAALNEAVRRISSQLEVTDEDAALMLPDPVIRVFVQHFDDFPRGHQEAIPMLRWKLKKSVPFEADETLLSYMRQAPPEEGVDVVTAIARLRIVKEYEAVLENAGLRPGVVLSSTLAAEHVCTMVRRMSTCRRPTSVRRNLLASCMILSQRRTRSDRLLLLGRRGSPR